MKRKQTDVKIRAMVLRSIAKPLLYAELYLDVITNYIWLLRCCACENYSYVFIKLSQISNFSESLKEIKVQEVSIFLAV